jgi:hypothetical protein
MQGTTFNERVRMYVASLVSVDKMLHSRTDPNWELAIPTISLQFFKEVLNGTTIVPSF